jgi:hypothetical protein
VITGSRQLVRQRLGRYRSVRPRHLAFVETLGLGIKSQGKVCRFDKGSRQVFVAIPCVAFAFLLAVADPLTIDAARL